MRFGENAPVPPPGAGDAVLLGELVAQHRHLVAVDPGTSVRLAAEAMARANVSCTAVVDGRFLVGIMTERDLVHRVLLTDANIDEMPVLHAMTREVIFARASDTVATATRLMREHQIRHLPIVDEKDSLLGVISIRDLMREEIHGMHDYIDRSGG